MRDRVVIIGAGHVGATSAYALMLRGLFREIVLIDDNAHLVEAEASDISDANALARTVRIWASDYSDARSAQIAIVTAGAATHGGEDRLSVASKSAPIVARCVQKLAAAGFKGVIVVASNPVDLMARVAFRHAGLPAQRIVGTGTLLDSSRLQQNLAARLRVAPSAIEAMVLGEHGNSEVAAFSNVRVGGMSLERFSGPGRAPSENEVAHEVKQAAYRIVTGKGYTSFGIATAIVRICEAILRDEKAVLPVSTLLTGQYGIDDVFLSLPCILGVKGVERILTPELNETEEAGLTASAAALKQALAILDGVTLKGAA